MISRILCHHSIFKSFEFQQNDQGLQAKDKLSLLCMKSIGVYLSIAVIVSLFLSVCSISIHSFVTAGTSVIPQFHAVIPRQILSQGKKLEILDWVKLREKNYDATESMLQKSYTYSPLQYHSTWKGNKVHDIRDTAQYAVALLDCEDLVMEKRAFDVLRKIVSLQDSRNESTTYGIWPYYLEEPLENMSPPDWNWADFIGTQLLQVVINHYQRLPADLAVKIHMALIHAARSIQRRNVGPGYTNIAIMGTHVTLAVSDIYNTSDLHQYSMKRLQNIVNFTKANGGFEEYNSPTYTIVALQELGRLKMHSVVPEAKQLVDTLYYIAWQEIVDHYHPATGQWAGPHSRAYNNFLLPADFEFLQKALKNQMDERLPLLVPADLQPVFQSNKTVSHAITNTYVKAIPGRQPDLIGTTYFNGFWVLGSVNWAEMWNQRRPLIAYWGDKTKTSYFRIRFLHDGFDFSSAQFFSIQKHGRVLIGIVLAIDGGDKHISLDRLKNGTVIASDFRLRFEIGGYDASNASVSLPTGLLNPIRLKFGNMFLDFAPISVAFDKKTGQFWNITQEKDRLNIDYVLFNGPQQSVQLASFNGAALVAAVQVADRNSTWTSPTSTIANDTIVSKWYESCLTIHSKPSTVAHLRRTVLYGC